MKRRQYTCDETFFDVIDTEAKAYWLGFIAADGNVYRQTLTIGLAPIDSGHLERFVRDLGGTQHVITRTKVDGFGVSTVKINSAHMVRALARYGIIPNKGPHLDWPPAGTLPTELNHHFLRGAIDGDGGWYWHRSRVGRPTWVLTLSGAVPFIVAARQVVCTSCNLTPTKLGRCKTPGNRRLSVGGNRQVAHVAHWLYDDATIWLPRKAESVRKMWVEAAKTVHGWAAHPEGCLECGTTTTPYFARGLCRFCYNRQWQAGRRQSPA